jgi:glycosyltransferase involved in cell wall biosynthesis
VHVVVPAGIDDPARPSGGNAYDRHVCDGLRSLDWWVLEHAVAGGWPQPDTESLAALADAIRRIPDGAVTLLDGLVASTAPEVLVPEAQRLRLVVLVHMPLGHRPTGDRNDTRRRERAVLSVAAAVITTSEWARGRLQNLYELPSDRVHVAEPGVEAAPLATAGDDGGGSLLCVAAVIFEKGHDVLLSALEQLRDLTWRCLCAGSLERDPAFAETIRRRALEAGLGDRLLLAGVRTGADLDHLYAAADLLVLASRTETYGMVVTESLARGLPVLAAEVGGLTEALGRDANGIRPGLLVRPEDPAALAAALRAWLCDAELRTRLRQAARERRRSLHGWSTTASVLAAVLAEV